MALAKCEHEVTVRWFRVNCTNKQDCGTLQITDFTETEHDITIITPYPNEFLKRGWVGNLTYVPMDCRNLSDGSKNETFTHTHNDVLLKNVSIVNYNGGCPDWKYVFLKD